MRFQQWKNTVNSIVRLFLHIDTDLIDDLPYWDLWNKGLLPYDVGTYAIARQYVQKYMYQELDDGISSSLAVYKFANMSTNLAEGISKTPSYNRIHYIVQQIIQNQPLLDVLS